MTTGSRAWSRVALCAALLASVGCAREKLKVIGQTCDLNSDCRAPLVCRLERCRRQCDSLRDCAAGLYCAFESGLGACLLDDEAVCILNSDCPGSLVCPMGTCINECRRGASADGGTRDCPGGSTCTDAGLCSVPERQLCIYPSDCPAPMICGADQQCRLECLANRDCVPPRVCRGNLCELPDAGP